MGTDSEAFSEPEVLLAETRWVRALARGLVGDEHLAEDLSQQTLLAAWGGATLPVHASPARRRSWLSGALRNLVRAEFRGRKRRGDRERSAAREDRAPSTSDVLQETERQQAVVAAVLGLPEPYRTTLLLRYLRELDDDAVARAQGVARATVRVRSRRGLEMLRERLGRDLGRDWRSCLLALALPEGASPPLPASAASPPLFLLGVSMKLFVSITAVSATAALAWFLWPSKPSSAVPDEALAVETRPEPVEASPEPAEALFGGSARLRLTGPAEVQAGVEEEEPEFTGPGSLMSGRVVGPDQEPIAHAELLLFPQALYGFSPLDTMQLSQPRRDVSDSDGHFAFAGLVPSIEYGLYARAEGFSPRALDVRPAAVESITLYPAVRLSGRVLDARSGRPLAHVAVRVVRPFWDGERFARLAVWITGTDGRYEIEELPAGTEVRVEALMEGSAPFGQWVALEATDTESDLFLRAVRTIEGVVLDSESGLPVPGAALRSGGVEPRDLARTDARGRFRMDLYWEPTRTASTELWRGSRQMESMEPGLVAVHADGFCQTIQPLLDLLEGDPSRSEIRLLPAARIEGTVRDGKGSPLAGARVSWLELGRRFLEPGAWVEPGPSSYFVRTDEDGRFALPEAAWNAESAALEVRFGGRAPERVDGVSPAFAGDVRYLEIRIGSGQILRGRTFVNGSATRCYVELSDEQGTTPNINGRSEPDGHFALHGVQPGRYSVRICTGDGTAVWSEPRLLIVGDREPEPLELHIRASFESISGRVELHDGTQATGRDVILFATDRPVDARGLGVIAGMATSDEDGAFECRIQPGSGTEFRAIVPHGEFEVTQEGLSPGQRNVVLALPEIAPAVFALENAAGDPVPTAVVRFRSPGAPGWTNLFGGNEVPTSGGRLKTALPVGILEIRVSSPRAQLEEKEVRATVSKAGQDPIAVRW